MRTLTSLIDINRWGVHKDLIFSLFSAFFFFFGNLVKISDFTGSGCKLDSADAGRDSREDCLRAKAARGRSKCELRF